jgi:competence protein ComFB
MLNFDGIYNYYEQIVYSEIMKMMADLNLPLSEDEAEDVACIALNQLPARYVRHGVDATYYLSNEEHASMSSSVTNAVRSAVVKVKGDSRNSG